jgi:ribosomal protein S15
MLSVQGDSLSNNNNTTFFAAQTTYLNHFVSSQELDAALTRSRKLTEPAKKTDSSSSDPQALDEEVQRHQDAHNAAQEAVNRIMRLNISSSKDRTRVNIQRCIDTFGRHNTDTVLRPKPVSITHPSAPVRPSGAPRAGPDTGSPEVQAAILTTKILVLARQLETTGHKDKQNKRNLRLLVHRRQKLLNYLRRKERGGPRWQNLIASLGLTDAAWKVEISL